jgi:hypothetical protein
VVVSIELKYTQYDQDNRTIESINDETPLYDDFKQAYAIFLNTETETITDGTTNQTIVNLPLGMFSRYDILIPLFCIADERRRALANMQVFWGKYSQCRLYIPLNSVEGASNLLSYFTNGRLNDRFNGKTEEFYDTLRENYTDAITFPMHPDPDGTNYFKKLFTNVKDTVRPLVEQFMGPPKNYYARHVALQEATDTTVDIAYIFYDGLTSTPPSPSPTKRTVDEVCVEIYNDPERYSKLLAIESRFELQATLERYKECIPNDIKHRSAIDIIRSRLA